MIPIPAFVDLSVLFGSTVVGPWLNLSDSWAPYLMSTEAKRSFLYVLVFLSFNFCVLLLVFHRSLVKLLEGYYVKKLESNTQGEILPDKISSQLWTSRRC